MTAAVVRAEFERVTAEDLGVIGNKLIDVVSGVLAAAAHAPLAIGGEPRNRVIEHVRDKHGDTGFGQEILALDF